MALNNLPVFTSMLSSCDFYCDATSNKLRIKQTAIAIDNGTTVIPSPYTGPTVPTGTQLKDGALVVDIYADAVVYVQLDCDGNVVGTPTVMPRDDNDSTTAFVDNTGGNAPATDTVPPVGITGNEAAGDTIVGHYDDYTVFYSFDGTNWTEDFRVLNVTTLGSLDNVNASADSATDCSILMYDATNAEYIPFDPSTVTCADITLTA